MDRRIFQQIETKAGFFDPPVYDDALNYHNQVFGTQNDPLAFTFRRDSYQPLTSALIPSDKTVLPFIVGLLPPSAVVTGRLLDRSATIASVLGTPSTVSIPPDTGIPGNLNPSSSTGDGKGTRTYKGQRANEQAFYDKLVAWCRQRGINPVDMLRVGLNESGLSPKAVNPTTKAAGVWQLTWPAAKQVGLSKEEWAQFSQLSASEQMDTWFKYFSPSILPSGASRGDIYKAVFLPYSQVNGGDLWVPTGMKNGKPTNYVPVKKGTKYYDQNYILDFDKNGVISIDDLAQKTDYILAPWVEDGLRRALAGTGQTLEDLYAQSAKQNSNGLLPPAGNTSWATSGSQNANQAQQAQTQTAGKSMSDLDMQRAELNRRYTAAQTNVIRALQISLQQMAATPPLKMLVNPESFKVSSQKIVSDGNWTRNGPTTIEHWGDAQDTISASGRIAGFYAVPLDQPSLGGLSRSARNFSDSYRNFLSLFLIYRNNGGIWLEDFADAKAAQTTKPNNLALVGSVYIYYDSTLYIGSFDSFEVSESDAAPFTLSYTFNFTVRQTFLLDRLDGAKPNAQTPTPTDPTSVPTTSTPTAPVATPVAPPPPDNYAPPAVPFWSAVEDRSGIQLSTAPTNRTKGEGIPLGPLDVSFPSSPKKGKK